MTRKNLLVLNSADIIHIMSKVFNIPEYDMKMSSSTDPYYGDNFIYLNIETESTEKSDSVISMIKN